MKHGKVYFGSKQNWCNRYWLHVDYGKCINAVPYQGTVLTKKKKRRREHD